MTREIEQHLGTRPEVRLLHEGPDTMSDWEAAMLGLSRRGRAYAREIALVADGRPVLLARSLSPMDDPVAGVLRRLQRAPLADVLFRDPRWRRTSPPITLRWRSHVGVLPGRACLWQRQAAGGRVLVEEFFLAPLTGSFPAGADQ